MCRDGRALVDNGEAAHAAGTRTLAAAARRPVRPVRLPHLPRHPQRADRARAVAVVGPGGDPPPGPVQGRPADPRSEEHTSELQSLMRISYAVFCLKKKNTTKLDNND